MSIYINQLIQQLNLPNTFISTTHSNSYLLTAKLEPLPVGGVHRFRTGPDRPGSKTEYRVGGGPGTGLDRSDQDCPFAFCWPTMRHGLPMPNGTTTLPLSQNFFFLHQDRPIQPSDARFPGQQCGTICLCRRLPIKKNKKSRVNCLLLQQTQNRF